MSATKPILNESEVKLLGQAWQCLKDGSTNITSQIDFDKLAALAGHTNTQSTRNAIGRIKTKLAAGSASGSAPSTPATTPKKSTSKTTTPATSTKKRKNISSDDADDEETPEAIHVKKEEDLDDDTTPPSSKAKRTGTSAAAAMPTPHGRGKKAKTGHDANGDATSGVADAGTRSRSQEASAPANGTFTPVNGRKGKALAGGGQKMAAIAEEEAV